MFIVESIESLGQVKSNPVTQKTTGFLEGVCTLAEHFFIIHSLSYFALQALSQACLLSVGEEQPFLYLQGSSGWSKSHVDMRQIGKRK